MKRFRKTGAICIALVLMFSAFMAGCGKKADGSQANSGSNTGTGSTASSSDESSKTPAKKATIRWGAWGSAHDFEAFEKMAEGVNTAIPEIEKIEFVQYASDGDFWTSLPSQIAAGTAPDLVVLTNENAYEYINGELFVPLDKNSLTTLDKIYAEGVNVWTVDGKLYGYPIDMQPSCLFVNLDLWAQCGFSQDDYPETWDDVKAVCKTVKSQGRDFCGLCMNAEGMFFVTQVVQGFSGGWGFGGTIVSERNTEAVQWLIDMFKEGLAASPKQIGADWDGSAFSSGQALMSIGGTWYLGQISAAAPDTKYIALPMPQQYPDKKVTTLHSDAVVILRGCKDAALATRAAEYIGRAEAQVIREEGTGNIPSIPELAENYYVKHPEFAPLKQALSYAVSFGYPQQTTSFTTTFINEFTKVVYDSSNNTTAEELLKTVENTYIK